MLRPLTFLLLCSFAHADEFDPLRAVVSKAIAKGNPAGAVLWLESGDKKLTLVEGQRALVPAKEAMTEDTVFDAASLTKVVATLPSVLILMEQGKIELEAEARRYIPEMRAGITVRHLLTHTSGFRPGIPKEPEWSGYAAGIERAIATEPDGPPGRFFRYSDINFILLGEIVQRVSGMQLNEFAAQHVFQPLHMDSTRFLPPEEWQPRIAPTEKDDTGTMLRGVVHDPTSRKMGGVTGHAGLFTTAGDLARYAHMILAGGAGVLKPETVKLMTAPQTPATVFERRGLGWDIDSTFSRPRGKIFPVGSFGHTGFTGTSLWLDPASQTFVIFMSSRLHPDGKGSVRDLYEEIGTAAAKCVKIIPSTGPPWPRDEKEMPTVLNGIDVLTRRKFADLKGLRIGLITNQTGIDARRHSTIDLLAKAPEVKLKKLFSPEHGIRGELDQEKISNSTDKKTGLPVLSLYGTQRAPTQEQLADVDALVFDIQDIGCRFYTYIGTMRLCMESAAKAKKPFYVLDRVNPIGGLQVEGPALIDAEKPTATHAIPLRHGMTAGELAAMMNAERAMQCDLKVIPVEGWQRHLLFDQTGLPWINPSPNMRSLNAALLYPGIGLLEFSITVGRGTDTPFEVLGAPYVDDLRLSYELNKLGLPGVQFTPIRFTPAASVFKGEPCGGVRMAITDRTALNAVDVGIAIASTLQRLYPKEFKLALVDTLLNRAASVNEMRAGGSWKKIVAAWATESQAFETRRERFLKY
ncbi:exo-beta-N-acetylmuramidase NamZ domain-containing protein [Prosthecobacter fluviatilis]|uniref:Exo-beta-N-acetylmuramidase NamZ domain-containing protein n=1 Tax=Prosthecobacter fluviatilis TaxID=445931 RepID=A0ABW0KSL0_9BACT